MNLRELLEDEAGNLPGIESIVGPEGSMTWTRAGRPFAVVAADGSVAEFALDPAVADAAARTPDVKPSARGVGWVVFTPAVLDEHGADRAAAWLASAHRRIQLRN